MSNGQPRGQRPTRRPNGSRGSGSQRGGNPSQRGGYANGQAPRGGSGSQRGGNTNGQAQQGSTQFQTQPMGTLGSYASAAATRPTPVMTNPLTMDLTGQHQPPAAPAARAPPEVDAVASSSKVTESEVDAITAALEKGEIEPKLDDMGNIIIDASTPEISDAEVDPAKTKKTKKTEAGGGPADDEEDEEVLDGEEEVPLESIKPLQNGQDIRVNLPKDLQFLASEKALYPEWLNGVYNYRAAAQPVRDEISAKGIRKITGNKWVAITFHPCGKNETEEFHLGAIGSPGEGELDFRCAKLQWILHSQVPGIRIVVDRGNGTTATVTIHANSLRRITRTGGEKDVGFEMGVTNKDTLIAHPMVNRKTDSTCFIGLRLNLHDPAGGKAPPYGPPYSAPYVEGVSDAELRELYDRSKIGTKEWFASNADESLSPGDWTLLALLYRHDFTIYRPWQNSKAALEIFEKFSGFFRNAMVDCSLNGNWPHYRRQSAAVDKDISDRTFNIAATVPPRDMVRKWRVTWVNSKPVAGTAESWWGFNALARYPDPESKGFALRLGIERDRDFGQAAIQEQLDSRSGTMTASITPFPRTEGQFWFQITGDRSEGRIFRQSGHPRPALYSRLEIIIVGDEHDGVKFKGAVSEDAFASGAEITAIARPLGDDAKKFKLARGETINAKVSLELKGDGTSSNRQNAAICELSKPLERQTGVDLPALVMNTPQQIQKTGSLWDDIKGNGEAVKRFWEIINMYHLNDSQREAARRSLESLPSALTIHGPPGTGKTLTLLVIALAHIFAGRISGKPRKFIATAPSNSAVANMARKMIVLAAVLVGTKIRMCHFKGSTIKGGPAKNRQQRSPLAQATHEDREAANKELGEADESTVEDIWEWVELYLGAKNHDKDLVPYQFSQQRYSFVDEIRKDASHQWNGEANYWFQENGKMRDKKLSAEEKKQARSNLDTQEHIWDQRYLEACDIVFCTNSTAAHEVLMDYYKPNFHISDEAALASLPDAATPMAAFKESIQHTILAGDHKQQAPPSLSKGASETYRDTSTSLFAQLQGEKSICDKVMLTLQHRMKASFSGMVSNIWYEGLLENHESLATKSPLERTIEQGLKKLGEAAWKGHLRLGVDVSGNFVQHERHDQSKSLINKAEAAMVADHVEWLLSLTPPANGRRIAPGDILVSTPYSGQVAEIRRQLAARKLRVDVMTTATVQGSERAIVLLSMVRNVPEQPADLGFVSDSKQLCVNFSRVKEYHVTFGNWINWVRAATHEKDSLLSQPTGKMADFRKILTDHHQQGDLFTMQQLQGLHAGQDPKPEHSIDKFLQAPKAPVAAAQARVEQRLDAFATFTHEESDKKKRKRRKGKEPENPDAEMGGV